MDNGKKIILHLCADVGSDTLPYREAGYDVRCIGSDLGVENYHPPKNVYGIIANPPCTMFSIARTTGKSPRDLQEGMRLVKECLRIIWECQYDLPRGGNTRTSNLQFWAIENPATGMLKHFLGKPTYQYSPHEFGADWTKRTALWGWFNPPIKPIFGTQFAKLNNSITDKFSIKEYKDKYDRMSARSMCYPEFAKAFFRANP